MGCEKGLLTAGDKARAAYVHSGEIFLTNIGKNGTRTLVGGEMRNLSVQEYIQYRLQSGEFESIRVEETAYDTNGRVFEADIALVAVKKKDFKNGGRRGNEGVFECSLVNKLPNRFKIK